jgi:hypothetical protein
MPTFAWGKEEDHNNGNRHRESNWVLPDFERRATCSSLFPALDVIERSLSPQCMGNSNQRRLARKSPIHFSIYMSNFNAM